MEQAPKDYDLERGGQTNPATNFSFRDPPDPFTRKRRRDPSQSANPDIVKAHHKHDETSRSALDQAVARSAKRTSTAGLGGSDALTQTAVRLTVGRDHISQSTVQRQEGELTIQTSMFCYTATSLTGLIHKPVQFQRRPIELTLKPLQPEPPPLTWEERRCHLYQQYLRTARVYLSCNTQSTVHTIFLRWCCRPL